MEQTNKTQPKDNNDIFNDIDNKEKQLDLNGKDATSKLEALKQQRAEVMEGGSLEELASINNEIEEAQEEEDELKAPSLDDLDDRPQSEKYSMLGVDEDWDKDTVLTIERVRLQSPRTKDVEGNTINPLTSANGAYYKAKMMLDFAEEVNGKKMKQSVPSIFYGVNDNGEVQRVPSIPQACSKDMLGDRMTSGLAKLRRMYCDFIGKDPKNVSNKEFAQGLVGMKVKLEKESGVYQGSKWCKLVVTEIVK